MDEITKLGEKRSLSTFTLQGGTGVMKGKRQIMGKRENTVS